MTREEYETLEQRIATLLLWRVPNEMRVFDLGQLIGRVTLLNGLSRKNIDGN